MKRSLSSLAVILLAVACLAGFASAQAAPQAAPQAKPVDMKKILAEIVGEYNFDVQGQSMLLQFTEREGKLYGAPVGEPEELLNPVEGKPLCFDVTVAESGQYYYLEFVRNEKGVVDSCLLTTGGMSVSGLKVIK